MNYRNLLVVTIAVGLQACATSRSVVTLDGPEPAGQVTGDRGSMFIGAVSDRRTFEQAPRDPSTPSLGFEGAQAATDDVKARAIGRKRNTYGKALGDVMLPEGKTVEDVIRRHASAALADAGWRVVEDEGADHRVDIDIDEFWAWFQPGFWGVTLNSNVRTTLTFESDGRVIPVQVHAEDTRQVATDSAWKEIVEMALEQYRRELSQSVSTIR